MLIVQIATDALSEINNVAAFGQDVSTLVLHIGLIRSDKNVYLHVQLWKANELCRDIWG